MEYIISKRENISNLKKLYLNDIDNSSTDFTEKMNDSNRIKQEKKIFNYCLEKIIFKSNTSKVFLAKHIITGEKVAIKILNKKLFKSDILGLKRIKKEIQILKMVKHENIINLLEIIENNNNIYLITDYYQNDLISLVIKNKKLSEEKSLYYFSQYVNGLNYLYQSGICHRNIRPENLLLDERNEKLKIIDFGLSTTYKKNELLNSIVGAIIYAPPEMHLSEKYSGELVDIWNAGIVLYFMVCGKLPFCDEDEEKNIKHIITGFYEIPSFISKHCAEIIKSCLQVDPNKRINFSQLSKYINYTKGLIFEINLIPFDDKILEECKKYLRNINNKEIIEKIKTSVINNKFNEFNALYYLVLKKMERKGYKSISDLSSDKFKNYIAKNDPFCETIYKLEKTYNYNHKNSNANIKHFDNNKNNNTTIKNKSLSNLNKNQLIYSPVIIKNYSSKKSSIQRNKETKNKFMNPNLIDSYISYKKSFKSNDNLDNLCHNYSNDYKLNKVKSISPRSIYGNDKDKIKFYSKFFIKRRLLNSKYSYSSYTNKKANLSSMKIYNNDNNFLDYKFYISFNKTYSSLNNNELLSKSNKNKKNYSNGFINVLLNETEEKNKDAKTMEIMERLKDNKITNYYDRKKYFFSQRIDEYKSKDQNNNLINILTEDKPIENFSLNCNINSNCLIGNEPTKFNKYNNFYCNSCNKIKDGLLVKKLKVRKNAIKKGTYGLKSNIFFKDIGIKEKGNNNISVKNSFKIKEKQNIYQKNIIKNNNHASFHKKNNSALLINFDYKNQIPVIKEKNNLEKRIISELNVNNNQNKDSYKNESYEIGVFDLSCLTINSFDKIKEKINIVFKTKKINFNNIKNNKYICSKLGKFFEIDIYTLNNFLRLNNGFKIRNNKIDSNSKNKKLLCYLSFHFKKLEYKKYVNNILKEINI